jgi:iron complex transport system substrate-binding protein
LYRLDEGALRVLDPDLVVTQDLCAVCAVSVGSVAAALDYLGCDSQVLTIDPGRLDDVLASIDTLGSATGNEGSARQLVAVLRERLARVAVAVEPLPRPRVAALEWPDPPFNAGHWVPDMIVAAGGEPVLGAAGERSVQVDWSALAECRPDVVVVSPCGYHLDDAHRVATDLVGAGRLPPGVPVWAVDADAAFVRPGPRLVDGVEGLAAVLHPQRLPARPDITRYAGTTPAIGARHA